MMTKETITLDRIEAAIMADDNSGFCKACGSDAYNVEPDARGYKCEGCDEPQVFGAEEFLL